MKKLLIIGLVFVFTMLLTADLVTIRFIDSVTLDDWSADLGTLHFTAILMGTNAVAQTELSPACGFVYTDVGLGVPNSYFYFDTDNFKTAAGVEVAWTPAMNVEVQVWDGSEVADIRVLNIGNDITPYNGFLGWGPFAGGFGGDPMIVVADGIVDPGDIDWGNGVTGNVDQGAASGEGQVNVPFQFLLEHPENAGYYFILTIDDALLPTNITITLDHVALGYVPWNLAYWFGGMWHYVGPAPMYTPAPWVNPGTATATVTFEITAGKGGRAPVDIPIVFADGPNEDDALPVTLTNFLVNQAQNGQFATIAWTVQSESNMLHYNLYRSETDLESALKIVTINAENSSELYTYRHVDSYEIAYTTTYYYWLEGVEVNGHSAILANGEVTMEEPNVEVPVLSDVTKLDSNYPNPFNPTTKIKYFVKAGETATLQIFNAKGQLVQTTTLGETTTNGGSYTFEGSKYGSGIYFYRLKTDNYSEVKKMMMLK